MDTVSPKVRSGVMARIRKKNTRPEVTVRKLAHALGLRFRVHRADLPGTPDIVLPKFGAVIFVHGCFWHQHEGCRLARLPKSRTYYWHPKLLRNSQRDLIAKAQLKKAGWKVFVVWECETKTPQKVENRLRRLFLRGKDLSLTARYKYNTRA
jgi:DNA mismatch endonuclease, patch repair protein